MRNKRGVLLPASFLLPLLLLLCIFAVNGLAPFGSATLLQSDGRGQYVSYFALYQDLFAGRADWFYSFEKLLGGSLSGLFAYYLASPFNLLLLLFPRSELPLAMNCLILLKMSCCGLTMALYLDGTHGLKPWSLIFTTAYALCGYNNAYAWCIMWLDAVVLLPLVALGIERLWQSGRPVLYVFSLSAAILFCFYTGYMLCVFSVLYLLWRLSIDTTSLRRLPWKKLLRFAGASLLAGGVSAGMLLPGFLALSGGVPISPYYSVTRFTYPAALRVLQLLLPGLAEPDRLVAPVLAAVLLLLGGSALLMCRALLSETGSRKVRIFSVILCLGLFTAWYVLVEFPILREQLGFTDRTILTKFLLGYVPYWEFYNGSPNVYVGSLALLLCFSSLLNRAIPRRERAAGFLLLLALLASVSLYVPNLIWHGFEENNCFNYRYSFVLSFVLLMLAESSFRRRDGLSRPALIVPFALCAGILVLTVLRPIFFWESRYALLSALFLLLGLGALLWWRKGSRWGIAAVCAVELCALCLSTGMTFHEQSGHGVQRQRFRETYLREQARIDSVLLADDDFYRIRKEGTVVNTNDPMLFSYPGLVHFSSSEKLATIALLGRLGLYTSPVYWANGDLGGSRAVDTLLGVRYYLSGSGVADYEQVGEGLWRNPHALPLAYAASLSAADAPALDNDACLNINRAYSALTGAQQEIFRPAGSEDLRLVVTSTEPLYFQPWDETIGSCTVQCGEEVFDSGKEVIRFPCAVYLGSFSVGDELILSVSGKDGAAVPPPDKEYLFYEDSAALADAVALLHHSPCTTLIRSASNLETTVTLDEESLLVYTLPWDEGWQITIDGEASQAETALGVLMAVRLTPGSHTVALRFTPAGLLPGLAISAASLALTLLWCLLRRCRRGK